MCLPKSFGNSLGGQLLVQFLVTCPVQYSSRRFTVLNFAVVFRRSSSYFQGFLFRYWLCVNALRRSCRSTLQFAIHYDHCLEKQKLLLLSSFIEKHEPQPLQTVLSRRGMAVSWHSLCLLQTTPFSPLYPPSLLILTVSSFTLNI